MAPIREKIGYGLGDMSSSMFWKIFSYYLPIFYTNIFGLSPAHAAFLLLITKLYDAVSDPVMGIIADRTNTKWGRYRPYLLWMAVPFGLIGVLSFYTPECSYTWKLVYAYVMYLLMMTVYTGINVPYGAMLGVVSDDPAEKNVFSSFRMFFAYIGSFVAMGIFGYFESQVGSVANGTPGQWTMYVGIVSILCVILFIGCFLLTREHVKPEPKAAKPGEGSGIMKDLVALLKNGPWWLLLGGAIGLLLFGAMRGGAMAYYFAYILEKNLDLTFALPSGMGSFIFTLAIFLLIGEISQMVGVVFTVPLSNLIGKKSTFAVCLIALSVLSAGIYFVPMTMAGFWVLVALQVLVCIGIGVISPLMWSMFADVADASELKNGTSSVGLIFSSSSMAQKFGGTIGSTLLMVVLAYVGFDAALAEQSPMALEGIRALVSWIPAVGTLLGLVFVLMYPLTTKKMRYINEELRKIRAHE